MNFQNLEKVYGDAAIGYSAVKKRVFRIKGEEKDPSLSDLRDKEISGRLSSALNSGYSARAEELIRDDRRVTIDDIAERLRISHGRTVTILGELGFAKICSSWAPRQLTDAHKQTRLETCLELLKCHAVTKLFLNRIVTGDEAWVHHYKPKRSD